MRYNFPIAKVFKTLVGIIVGLLLLFFAYLLAFNAGCVPTEPLEGAVRDGLRDGLHKGISEGLTSASGIASDKLLVLLPDIIDKAVGAATEKVVAKMPTPRELPIGVEYVLAVVTALGWRWFDHWRKARRAARIESGIDDQFERFKLRDPDELFKETPEPVDRRPEPTPAPPLPQVQGSTNQETAP